MLISESGGLVTLFSKENNLTRKWITRLGQALSECLAKSVVVTDVLLPSSKEKMSLDGGGCFLLYTWGSSTCMYCQSIHAPMDNWENTPLLGVVTNGGQGGCHLQSSCRNALWLDKMCRWTCWDYQHQFSCTWCSKVAKTAWHILPFGQVLFLKYKYKWVKMV